MHILTVDCVWYAWGEWSTCSTECGEGQQSRTRTKMTEAENGGAQCVGNATEVAFVGKFVDVQTFYRH